MAVTDFQKFMDDQLHKATGYIGVSHSSGSSKASSSSSKASSSSSKASASTPTLAGAKPAQAPAPFWASPTIYDPVSPTAGVRPQPSTQASAPSFNTTPRMSDASQASQLKGVENIMRTAVNEGIRYKRDALAQDGNLKRQQLASTDNQHAREIGLKKRTTLTAGQQYSLGQLPYATQKETKRMELEGAKTLKQMDLENSKTLKQMDLENSKNLAQFNVAGNILAGLVTKGNNYSYLGSV